MSLDPADAWLLVADFGSDDTCALITEQAEINEGQEETRLAEISQSLPPAWPGETINHSHKPILSNFTLVAPESPLAKIGSNPQIGLKDLSAHWTRAHQQ